MWFIYMAEYDPALIREEVLTPVPMWMDVRT